MRMMLATRIFFLFGVFGILLVPAAMAGSSFDGTWQVSLVCPDNKDATGRVARGYSFQFPAQVKDGVLHGEHGTKGAPGWLVIDGKIQSSGGADLHVNGLTGQPERSLMHVESGKPYSYQVKARFEGNRGTGSRYGGRICNYTFVKS
jgi:hypothetical protein